MVFLKIMPFIMEMTDNLPVFAIFVVYVFLRKGLYLQTMKNNLDRIS